MNLLEISDQDWEEGQKGLGGHLLQSAPWSKFQESIGRELAGRVQLDDGSAQTFRVQEASFSYLWAPYGPTIVGKSGNKLLQREAWQEANVDFIRFEPMGVVRDSDLLSAGAVPSVELNPAHTLVIDLTKSEAELRSNLSSGHRSAVNSAERRGLSFEEGSNTDITQFLSFIHQTGRRKGFRPHPDNYYHKMMMVLGPEDVARIYLAKKENHTVATAVIFDYNNTRIYAHAATDSAAKQLQPAVPLVWHLILDAKKRGLKLFDLWGVAAPNTSPNHPWAGFSQFKRAFGGTEVSYLGTWDLPLKPLRYRLYRSARRANRWVRR